MSISLETTIRMNPVLIRIQERLYFVTLVRRMASTAATSCSTMEKMRAICVISINDKLKANSIGSNGIVTTAIAYSFVRAVSMNHNYVDTAQCPGFADVVPFLF